MLPGEDGKLLTAVGANPVLGVPGIVPIFLGYCYLTNGPLWELGWTSREPAENDACPRWRRSGGWPR
ncbi:hypothetical protein [Actinoplanes sp. NPDC020271]|uniref:hypothetical protein n=1 Tax=Actinoplanes sp. NPDC020271 TaxID=3363896 RepID=UPI0037AFC14C